MEIFDNIIFHNRLNSYANNEFSLSSEPIVNLVPNVSIVDDYKSKQIIHEFDNVLFRFESEAIGSFTIHPIGVCEGKIINITHKMLSYFPIVSENWTNGLNEIKNVYHNLTSSDEIIEIDYEVFQFFDCFPYAPVHNLDDIYNLLYYYFENNLKCKLLVVKTDNFFYNQSLISLKNHFNLDFIYIEPNKNYKFKKFKCTRQYHWVQPKALEFIKNTYITKICELYVNYTPHDNLSIVKIIHHTNASTVDTFHMSQEYQNLLIEKNIFDCNTLINNLELKIYLVNNAKNIITSYLSPFNINIYKHCLNIENKNFIVLNGGYGGSIVNQFKQLTPNTYDFYGKKINGIVIDDKISLSDVKNYINF